MFSMSGGTRFTSSRGLPSRNKADRSAVENCAIAKVCSGKVTGSAPAGPGCTPDAGHCSLDDQGRAIQKPSAGVPMVDPTRHWSAAHVTGVTDIRSVEFAASYRHPIGCDPVSAEGPLHPNGTNSSKRWPAKLATVAGIARFDASASETWCASAIRSALLSTLSGSTGSGATSGGVDIATDFSLGGTESRPRRNPEPPITRTAANPPAIASRLVLMLGSRMTAG